MNDYTGYAGKPMIEAMKSCENCFHNDHCEIKLWVDGSCEKWEPKKEEI